MKKKFLAMYALAGVLVASPVFTSCVDNEESPSVTQLRNAKAEQLKALASLYTAQAESEAVTAAADAAYKNAMAEAQLAQAKLNEAAAAIRQAELALQETENEKAKLQLEAQKAQLEVTKKEAEAELARIQNNIEKEAIRVEAELLSLQQQLLWAKQQLENTTEDLAEQEKAKLQELANEYTNAVNQLLNAKKQLAALNSELANLEGQFVDAKASLEETVAYYKNQIALNNIRIESFKQYANYTEDYDALNAKYVTLQTARDKANSDYNTAWDNYINTEIDNEAISEAVKAIMTDDFYRLATTGYDYWDNEKEERIVTYPVSNFINGTSFSIGTTWIENKEYWRIWGVNSTISSEDGDFPTEYEYNDMKSNFGHEIVFQYETEDLAKVELEIYNYTEGTKSEIKRLEEAIKENNTALEAAVKAEADAKKAWEEAEEADKNTKKAEYETALNNRLAIENTIEADTESLENNKKQVTNVEAFLEVLKKGDAALQEKIKVYNETVKAAYAEKVEAWKVAVDTQIAYEDAQAEVEAVEKILYHNDSAGWLNNRINDLEESNEIYEEWIEEAEKLLTYENGQRLSYEEVIEFKKAEIEAKEAEVAAKEVAVEEAKKALDAAMPKAEEAE